jgi:hypothetical protein
MEEDFQTQSILTHPDDVNVNKSPNIAVTTTTHDSLKIIRPPIISSIEALREGLL